MGVRPGRHVAFARHGGPSDDPARGAAERAATRRTTSKGIGAGDIVEIDKRGRRFHALVTELEQLESGRFELVLRPLDSRISYRTATVREVLTVWRRVSLARACGTLTRVSAQACSAGAHRVVLGAS